jgi:predicted N-formylglutamate amidohydrolase
MEALWNGAISKSSEGSPEDGVAHTLGLHAPPRGFPNVTLEIRSELIDDAASQAAA